MFRKQWYKIWVLVGKWLGYFCELSLETGHQVCELLQVTQLWREKEQGKKKKNKKQKPPQNPPPPQTPQIKKTKQRRTKKKKRKKNKKKKSTRKIKEQVPPTYPFFWFKARRLCINHDIKVDLCEM